MNYFDVLYCLNDDLNSVWMINQVRCKNQTEAIAIAQEWCNDQALADGSTRLVIAAGPCGAFDKYLGKTTSEIDY